MEIFIGWVLLSLLMGALGSDKNIGFWGAFLLSLLLSPLIGLIIVLCSGSKMIFLPPSPSKVKSPKTEFIGEELIRLKSLLDSGVITEDEFGQQKRKLMA
jgi:hypothetical protein